MILKITAQYLYYFFLTDSSKEHYTQEFHNFITNTKLFLKVNMASLGKNQHPTLYLNSPRSVTLHLTVKNTLVRSVSSSVWRLILYAMIF